jgi:hypothetical protein
VSYLTPHDFSDLAFDFNSIKIVTLGKFKLDCTISIEILIFSSSRNQDQIC